MFSPLLWLADCMNFHIAVDSGFGCCHSFRGVVVSDAMPLDWSPEVPAAEVGLPAKLNGLSIITLTRQFLYCRSGMSFGNFDRRQEQTAARSDDIGKSCSTCQVLCQLHMYK